MKIRKGPPSHKSNIIWVVKKRKVHNMTFILVHSFYFRVGKQDDIIDDDDDDDDSNEKHFIC